MSFTQKKNRIKVIAKEVKRTRLVRAFTRFTEVGGTVLSAGMSFQAVFAVFAALWVGFGILANWLRGREDILTVVSEQINEYVPGLIAVEGDGIISLGDLLNRSAFDWSSAIASIALIGVTLNWFTGTRRAIRLIFGLEVAQYRNAILLKLRDLIGAIALAVAVLVSAALTVASSGIFSWALEFFGMNSDNWFIGWMGVILRYAATLAVDVLIIMGIHRLLAEVRVPFRTLLFGSILGGLALLVLKILANTLLGGASSNPLLATFAVFVGLLLWFNFICRALLLTSAWIATGVDRSLGMPES